MEFKIGQTYGGFVLQEKTNIPEVGSNGLLFEHVKTGAKLFYLSNQDDNKVFSISFRTPPEDSTGLPHILEHSVLCGSEKYPVKEPFVELLKGSMNTFLNAMTFPDKTMYPVASTNHKDFMNLVDVYLDAVFNPVIYTDENIFLQEGWHYHIEREDDDIEYVGVVYNEMKGAFSNPEEVVNRKIQESLFPDTPYGKESGGDPEHITELSYEDFTKFHSKYYHPSNSFIYFYGDGDILGHLEYIDKNYLNKYDRQVVDSEIPIQKSFAKPREAEYLYPVSVNEGKNDKTYLSMNFVTGLSTDPQIHLSLEILTHILLDSPSSPLKKALLEAQLGKDVEGYYEGGILQPVISVVVKNSNPSKKEEFVRVVEETLRSLVQGGLDKEQVEAAININEFRLKEADYGSYPKGLIFGIRVMDSWLYGGNPEDCLKYEEYFKNIRNSVDDGYFEDLIQKYLIDNTHRNVIIVKPEPGLVDKNERETAEKLKEFKNSLSKDELNHLVEQTKDLIKRQNTPDRREDIEKIPVLALEDIEKTRKKLPLEERDFKGRKVLYHQIDTNGIVYLDLLFDIRNISKELIPYAALLVRYLGEVSTGKYDFSKLNSEIEIYTGGIDYDVDVYEDVNIVDSYRPMLIVKGRALSANFGKLCELIKEILTNSKYSEKQRLKEIIQSSKSKTETLFMSVGHKMAANRVQSYYSQSAKFLEYIDGVDYYNFIKYLDLNFESKYEEIFENLHRVSQLMFKKDNVIVSLTCSERDYGKFEVEFGSVLQNLCDGDVNLQNFDFKLERLNEGLMTSSKVQYVSRAYDFRKLQYEYSGILRVVKSIVSTNYLWNKIRVQGGAYGSYFNLGRDGTLVIGSYRDPNLKNTVDAIGNLYKYLESFTSSKREMDKYIIGTISELDMPLTPWSMGNRATGYYLRNIKDEDLQRERNEVLNCSVEDVVKTGQMLKDCMDEGYLCVVGNEGRIRRDGDLFLNLVDLFA